MRRFSGLFGKGKKDDSSSKSPSSKAVDPERFGVSLKFLASLPIEPDAHFSVACEYVNEQTKNGKGYRSFAKCLFDNPKTRHFVKEQADVFVSYAWSGGFGKTMSALLTHFGDNDVFVWMDFVVVDQHAAAETNIQFDQWAKTFRENLKRIGKAVLVLTPGEKPIAITRSWCCFEWTSIVQSGIPFEYCVTRADVEAMINRMQNGDIGFTGFNTLFAGINVEKAEAFKKPDQESILALMKEIGIVKVNDIVMKSLKGWLLEVNVESLRRIGDQKTKEASMLLSARGGLHQALVRL